MLWLFSLTLSPPPRKPQADALTHAFLGLADILVDELGERFSTPASWGLVAFVLQQMGGVESGAANQSLIPNQPCAPSVVRCRQLTAVLLLKVI